ncbi:MAG: alpha/beta fold hydrolase, partial [Spirochaetaceae bacterium]
ALELSTTLYEIERRAARDDELFALVNDQGAASLALSESGQIMALNTAATEMLSVAAGDGLSALGINRQDFDAFAQRLIDNPEPSLLHISCPKAGGRGKPVLVSGVYYPWYRSFVLTVLRAHWPESVDRALAELYGLSKSERDILKLLARGLGSEDIADLRGRSLGTVRQQLKSITGKMGVQTQLAAATIAASAAAAALSFGDRAGHPAGQLPVSGRQGPLRTGSFSRGRRRVGWRQFGDQDGVPVLFLHGPSFGAGEYPEDRRLAQRHGLNVYAPERPGYGRTDGHDPEEDVLTCQIRDACALLDQEKVERVTIIAHEVGLIPALAMARECPERVRGVLGVSAAPPFVKLEQIAVIPDHQSVFIEAARHAPWLAHLLIRLLIVQMRKLGPQEWVKVIFGDLEPDARVMHRPELLAGIVGSYSFYVNQLGQGFEQDLEMMHTDWSPLVADVPVPIRLLHGAENPTTPPQQLDIFRTLRPDIPIDLVERAGLTLAVSHPHLVYRALAEMARDE